MTPASRSVSSRFPPTSHPYSPGFPPPSTKMHTKCTNWHGNCHLIMKIISPFLTVISPNNTHQTAFFWSITYKLENSKSVKKNILDEKWKHAAIFTDSRWRNFTRMPLELLKRYYRKKGPQKHW